LNAPEATAVNVLAVIDREISRAGGDAYSDGRDLIEVRTAMAKVIDALRTLVAESVHPYDGGEYEDGEWQALDAARAALELIGGAS